MTERRQEPAAPEPRRKRSAVRQPKISSRSGGEADFSTAEQVRHEHSSADAWMHFDTAADASAEAAIRLEPSVDLCRKQLLLAPPRDFIGAMHYFTRADREGFDRGPPG